MYPTVPVAMIGWPILSIALFLFLPPRHAVMVAMLGGWLLLPQKISYHLNGLPEYSRFTANFLGIIIGITMFDARRIRTLRWAMWDILMLAWCISPIPSSMTNGLGLYDGVSGALSQVLIYGVPYLVGRLYFSTPSGLHYLLRAILVAALLYLPFVLIELWRGPFWHRFFYGYEHFRWHEIWRLGWIRPIVCLQSGHTYGLWSATAAILAIWHYNMRRRDKVLVGGSGLVAAILCAFAVFSQAMNAYTAGLIGLTALYGSRILRTRLPLIVITLVAPAYLISRISYNEKPEFVLSEIASISEDRAASLRSRISQEVPLIDRALEPPFFGWGTYNRNRVDFYEIGGRPDGAMGKRSITDSLWIIVLGQKGFFGLVSLYLCLLAPSVVIVWRLPIRYWGGAEYAAPALAVVTIAFVFDSLANAMVNPIFYVISGAMLAPRLFTSVRSDRPKCNLT